MPRLCVDVAQGHTRLTLGEKTYPHPIFLPPVAFQELAHPKGELETARGALAADTPLMLSTLASYSIEEVAHVSGGEKWFQLYLQPSEAASLDLMRRAKAAGYEKLVVTLDAPISPVSIRAQRAGFDIQAPRPVNLREYPIPPLASVKPGESRVFQSLMAQAPTWKSVEWLLKHSPLPVWIKGVLHPADAQRLKALGVEGLVVSNHGGRVLDGAPASLTQLPKIREAVGAQFPLLVDSGIRSGSDIFKAIALGADGVLIGRLQVYALAVAGGLGVAHVIKLLREELEMSMALAGCASLDDITQECLC
jgi:isopentenyl diphosphate isomerase/L-lactate dehydrogenase-like FMN-dependent dehydrogenase